MRNYPICTSSQGDLTCKLGMDLHNLLIWKSAILLIFKHQRSTATEESGELLSLWFIHLPSFTLLLHHFCIPLWASAPACMVTQPTHKEMGTPPSNNVIQKEWSASPYRQKFTSCLLKVLFLPHYLFSAGNCWASQSKLDFTYHKQLRKLYKEQTPKQLWCKYSTWSPEDCLTFKTLLLPCWLAGKGVSNTNVSSTFNVKLHNSLPNKWMFMPSLGYSGIPGWST